ncbi:MAG: iron-siderophore ABC transporter substrate-binding protein [Oculatellaceae cyanobacterium Prado106]|jgi:iron complex transport system substrate-binding protein|nr:iron-siderophore ABC transporter substrate-binding protein [Oculatellaceae cyanobacterium Prado106]
MFYRIPRPVRYSLLVVLAIALITACQRTAPESNPVRFGATRQDCAIVQHLAGETCVPLHPQRVVALDSSALELLLSLGIKPIGATLSDSFALQLQQDLTEMTNIGQAGEPNLEKVLALKPDLILGWEYYETLYPQISQIAPTLLFTMEHSGAWKETFLSVAQMLQKQAVAESVLAAYSRRLEIFKQQMGDRLQQIQVSVVRVYPDQITLYLKDSFCGVILQDAGLQRPDAQNISAPEAQQQFGNAIQKSISREVLSQADGDILFLWTGENTLQANQQAQKALAKLKADPLWQPLDAVQHNQIYQVPGYWIGIAPIAANLVIDDLFRHLTPSS